MKRRSYSHDYYHTGIYMLTIEVDERKRLLDYVIMEDHVHILVHVKRNLDRHLGQVVAGVKAPLKPKKSLFAAGYNDRIIYNAEQLDTVKRYIKDNPRRLATKRRLPHLFISNRWWRRCGVDRRNRGTHRGRCLAKCRG